MTPQNSSAAEKPTKISVKNGIFLWHVKGRALFSCIVVKFSSAAFFAQQLSLSVIAAFGWLFGWLFSRKRSTRCFSVISFNIVVGAADTSATCAQIPYAFELCITRTDCILLTIYSADSTTFHLFKWYINHEIVCILGRMLLSSLPEHINYTT